MIHSHLHLSIGHITKSTFEMLQYVSKTPIRRPEVLHDFEWPEFTVASYDIGVFVTVPVKEAPGYDKLPADLRAVFSLANNVNIKLICFDSIGSVWPHLNLPLYDWK